MKTRFRVILPLVALFAATSAAAQQPAAGGLAVQVAPHAYVVTEGGANMVLIVGARGSMVAGAQEPALVAKSKRALAALNAPPVKYALLMLRPGSAAYGDPGWEAAGSLALAHEALRGQMFRARRAAGANAQTPHLPSMGYSAVVQISMDSDEDAHAVHQPEGYSAGDVAVHFERSGILYLSSLTTDGYPEIDAEAGGTLSGLIKTVDDFSDNFSAAPQAIEPIVPARGPLATLADLRAFRDMLIAVRDRLNPLVAAGKTADDAVAAHPTAPFDARWGHGPVPPDRFVRMAFAALTAERATPAP